jgi:hypothetical protein
MTTAASTSAAIPTDQACTTAVGSIVGDGPATTTRP